MNKQELDKQQGPKITISEREIDLLLSKVERLKRLQETKDKALRDLMIAYERRIRSDCTTKEHLDTKPWECAEYCAAREALELIFTE